MEEENEEGFVYDDAGSKRKKKKKKKKEGTLSMLVQAIEDVAGDRLRRIVSAASEKLVELGVLEPEEEFQYETDDLVPALDDLILFDEYLPQCPKINAKKYKVMELIGEGSEGVEVFKVTRKVAKKKGGKKRLYAVKIKLFPGEEWEEEGKDDFERLSHEVSFLRELEDCPHTLKFIGAGLFVRSNRSHEEYAQDEYIDDFDDEASFLSHEEFEEETQYTEDDEDIDSENKFSESSYAGNTVEPPQVVFDREMWVMMELCRINLDQVLDAEIPLRMNQIRGIIAFVLRGLKWFHDKGIVHRDIKGENIMITKGGQIKLIDLDVAFKMDKKTKKIEVLGGSPGYMAPEMFHDEDVENPEEDVPYHDEKVDIWALGITLLELVLKIQPLEAFVDDMDSAAEFLIQFKQHRTDEENLDGSALGKLLITSFEHEPQLFTLWEKARKRNTDIMDFVTLCLRTDPLQRPTADQLCKHPFVKEYVKEVIKVEKVTTKGLKGQPYPKLLLPLRRLVQSYEEVEEHLDHFD